MYIALFYIMVDGSLSSRFVGIHKYLSLIFQFGTTERNKRH